MMTVNPEKIPNAPRYGVTYAGIDVHSRWGNRHELDAMLRCGSLARRCHMRTANCVPSRPRRFDGRAGSGCAPKNACRGHGALGRQAAPTSIVRACGRPILLIQPW